MRVGSGKAGYAESVDAARDDLEDLKSSMGMLFIPDNLATHHNPLESWVRRVFAGVASAGTLDADFPAFPRKRR